MTIFTNSNPINFPDGWTGVYPYPDAAHAVPVVGAPLTGQPQRIQDALKAAGWTSEWSPQLMQPTGEPKLAEPYVSTINVQGIEKVNNLKLLLNGLSTTQALGMAILLLAPDGKTMSVVMKGAGGPADIRHPVNNFNIAFDQKAPSKILFPLENNKIYQPTDSSSGDIFPDPAPPTGKFGSLVQHNYKADFNQFIGKPASGDWKLFCMSITIGFTSSIQSWALDIS